MKGLVALLLLSTAGAAGGAAGYQLFPMRGVFYPTDETPTRIDPDFHAAIGPEEQTYFTRRFRERFDSAKTISETNYRRTFAVSLQIARASRYTVSKIDGTVDLYAPVTGSLYFTNVATGEVLYAATRTTFKTISVMPDDAKKGKRVVSLFVESFHDVVDDLVGDAFKRFKPITVSATVRAMWNGLAILDGGTVKGIGHDDTLSDERGNELRVISSAPSYAVAVAELGTPAIGIEFSKVTNQTLAEIRKPRVLPLVVRVPQDFPEEALVQLFSDALGAKAAISLVPVNHTFGSVVRTMGGQIDLSDEKLRERVLPQFFVQLSVTDALSYDRPTNLEYKTLRVTLALAYAELIDRAGHVLYAAQATHRDEDEITSGMAFDPRARKEIFVKNALLALAKRFAAEFKFETTKIEIIQGGREARVRDEYGFLAAGMMLNAYRNIGKVKGIAADVLVPTWEMEAVGSEGEFARVAPVLPIFRDAPSPDRGDVLQLDGARAGIAQRKRFGPCGNAEKLGAVPIPEYEGLATNLFAASNRAPFYMVGTASKLAALVHGGSGFKEDLKPSEPKLDYCVQPVYRINVEGRSCSDASCAEVARIKLTYRVRHGGPEGDVKTGEADEFKMTASALPREVPEPTRAEALHIDLLEQVLKHAPAVAARVAQQKL